MIRERLHLSGEQPLSTLYTGAIAEAVLTLTGLGLAVEAASQGDVAGTYAALGVAAGADIAGICLLFGDNARPASGSRSAV